ncbi:aspartate kinase [Vibrio astriarenae]|uniref:Aspartokinase n=1 Tax=Vibrio astriarenae TaxID=1481923 RepID=A0A7Z2T4J1_9VIBR|nr:aspartate kinase [Vibrio astriarenae]QIA64244.1 aspartate kinase [Vibrio astriarenae]
MKKSLIVQKFGGTSMGSIETIHKVAEHIIRAKNGGSRVVVVVSAMSGETNRLMGLAQQVDCVPNARELDVLLSAGEQVSMALLAMTLSKLGHTARSLTGGQANIITDGQHNDATIKHIDTTKIEQLLDDEHIVIVAGFQGINENGDITTLGRGGSDTSAVALAGALKADECQIFTDVDGVYSCDPRVVKSAQRLDVVDFPSMEEMARKGAKVLHLPSVQTAWEKQVPLRVLSTFDLNQGSLIKGEECQQAVCGVAIQRGLTLVSVNPESVETIRKHCMMLGVSVWDVVNGASLLIKEDCLAKLQQVCEDKLLSYQCVSLLTIVGTAAERLSDHTAQLLALQDIDVVHVSMAKQSMSLVMLPDCIDKAANILHDAYITTAEAMDFHPKKAFLG